MATTMTRREFLAAGAAAGTMLALGGCATLGSGGGGTADLILHNGRIATLDPARPRVSAVAIGRGSIMATGSDRGILPLGGPKTRVIDLKGHTVIPGLNDSHIHIIRGGLNYNMELRWDGVPSLALALQMLREQARRTPAPQWVRVIGGWSEFQFAERRLPTLNEVNAVSPDTPVFLLHLYDRAILNRAALRALGYTKDTPDFPGSEIQRDRQGNPTGLLIAKPNALVLYASLAKGPKLSLPDQINSTRHFMRELNRLGITSAIDAGGGYQNYPEDYRVIEELAKNGQLTVRIAYNLFTQKPGGELQDFRRWMAMTSPGQGDAFYRMNGAGEMLVFSAADFEDFLEPRPDLPPTLEKDLHDVVRLLAENRWPFRLHATYNESISRFLDVFEAVDRDVPFAGLRWFFDHAETIAPRNIERVKALGGGIAIQDRMAFQGEYFVRRYGAGAAAETPPVRRMLTAGVPVGLGTDATRVASYNPWVALSWLVTGRTAGGTPLYGETNLLTREEALHLYTVGSTWFSGEEGTKGRIAPGQYADLSVLSADYFAVPAEEIRGIEALMTIVDGHVVYGAGEFAPHGPPPLPVSPDWSPVGVYGGYHRGPAAEAHAEGCGCAAHRHARIWLPEEGRFWNLGCDCFAI